MSRRNVLRGAAGVAVGLPFLEGLAPKPARAGTNPGLVRLLVMFEPNGIDVERFFPSEGGAITPGTLSGRALETLSGFSDRLLVPRGIRNSPSTSQGTGGDGHMQGIAHRLTGAPIVGEYASGMSIDQVVASQLNPQGRPALALRSGQDTSGVFSHLSYTGPGEPVVAEHNPWRAYQDLVGLAGLDDEALQKLVARRESVLDLVSEEFDLLLANPRLSAHDRAKLDMHATAIRDLEIDVLDTGLVACELDPDSVAQMMQIDGSGTVTFDSAFPDTARLNIRLMALAVACGATTAATLQLGQAAGGPIYGFDGLDHEYNHHKLSHGNTQDDDSGAEIAGFRDMIHQIDRWHADRFRELCELLDQYQEDDGTLLDNSVVVWCNELSDGFTHSENDLPFVIAGSGRGYLKQGQHLEVSQAGEPCTKLLTTLLNACGCTDDDGGPVKSFGDMNYGEPGELDAIKA